MSEYGAYDEPREPRRYKTTRTRPRERGEPEYVEETTFIERGKGPPPRELASYRPRTRNLERQESIEEIPRDFPPPEARRSRYRDDYEAPPPRRARSQAGRRDDYDDYDDYGPPVAAGAAAGYAAGRGARGGGGGGREKDQYSERRGGRGRDAYYSDEQSPPPRRERRKSQSGLEKTLEGLGLGGVVGAITGNSGKSRSGREDRGSDRSRSRPRGQQKERQWAQAAQAALIAGAVEAFRARDEPGPWTGEKGRRIATAAIAAGGIDRLVDRNPQEKTKRHLVEAVLGGLATNRLANGPTNKEGDGDARGRSRSRSRSVTSRFRSKSRAGSDSEGRDQGGGQRNGLKDLAAGGALAAVAKGLYDQFQQRSKSKGPDNRRRSPSESSDDSYVPSRNRRRDVGDSRSRAPPSRNPNETAVAVPAQRDRGRGGPEKRGLEKGQGQGRNGDKEKNNGKRSSSSSSISSTDLENRRKKMRGKEYLTAALASVATIHAAHSVYQSMESSDKRHRLVDDGEMSPEEARKKRSKAWLQDAASVGIAALGIKGAYSEWKEMNEHRHEMQELEERREKREKRRKKREREQQKQDKGGRRDRDDRYGGAPPPQGYVAPYYAGNVPPPPMGYAPNGRYA